MKKDAFIGIDPGAKGAICLLYENDHECIMYDPDEINLAQKLEQWQHWFNIKQVCIERVWAMSGQGVTSMFNFGLNAGTWKGLIVGVLRMKPEYATPKEWQDYMLGKKTEDRKIQSLRLYNQLANLEYKLTKNGKANGKADAYHLARYAEKIYKENL